MNLFNTIQCLKPVVENPGTGSITELEKRILRGLLKALSEADDDDAFKESFWTSEIEPELS